MRSEFQGKSSMVLAATVFAALLMSPAAGWSQGQASQEQPAQTQITGEDLQSFIKAQGEVRNIQEKYNDQLSNASDPEAQQAIVQKANEEMVSAIQDEGLDVQLYNAILTEAQNNEDFHQQIIAVQQSMQ